MARAKDGSTSAYYPEWTGLRAAAAAMVFLHHFNKWVDGASMGWDPGYLGVPIFFALSGFLITFTYYRKFESGFSFWKYWLLRLGRIYPAYLALLLLNWYFFESKAGPKPVSFWVTNLTLTQGFFFPHIWSGLSPVAWSLTVEECFYLLAPVLFFWMRARVKTAGYAWPVLVLSVALLACNAVTYLLAPLPLKTAFLAGTNMTTWYSILGRFSQFVPGIAVAIFALFGKRSDQNGGRQTTTGDVLFWTSLVFALFSMSLPGEGASPVYVSIAAAIFILSTLEGSRVARASFGNPVVVYLGKISYVTYLLNTETIFRWIHGIVASATGPGAAYAPVMYAFVVALSVLGYELIEKPCHAWVRGRLRIDAARVPRKSSVRTRAPMRRAA